MQGLDSFKTAAKDIGGSRDVVPKENVTTLKTYSDTACGEPDSICLVGWFLNVLVNRYAISRAGPKTDV